MLSSSLNQFYKFIMKNLFSFLLALSLWQLAPIQMQAQTEVFGCTNSSAANYNADATADDGSCCFDNYVTINTMSELFFQFSEIAPDGGSFSDYYGWSNINNGSLCIPNGCFTFYAYSLADPLSNVAFTITDSNGNVLIDASTTDGFYYQYYSNTGDVVGCMYSQACNFNPLATCGNAGFCDFTSCGAPSPYGCTDPNAPNYNPDATIEDGSCCYASNYLTILLDGLEMENLDYMINSGGWPVSNTSAGSAFCMYDGCFVMQGFALNGDNDYSLQLVNALGEVVFSANAAELEQGVSFSLNAVPGCTDYYACNYNPLATCSDNVLCDYSCLGCTNPDAGNYDPDATVDDGSCCVNSFTIVANGQFQWGVWSSTQGGGGGGAYPDNNTFCINNGCYTFEIYNYQNSLEPINWQLLDSNGTVVYSGQSGLWGDSESISVNSIEGCMDTGACNFNPLATCSNYTLCNYDCLGCTDPNAPNYNPEATIDNGSCCTQDWYTVNSTTPGYWYVYSQNGWSGASGHYPEQNGFCLGAECFNITFYADDFASQNFTISLEDEQGNIIATGQYLVAVGGAAIEVLNGAIAGCMDTYACNYNPLATCYDYESCDYGCYGCTNADAPNYDPNATIDDGSCCTGNWYTITLSGEGYWSASSSDYTSYQGGYYPQDNGFCSASDCFYFTAWSLDGTEMTYTINDLNGTQVDQGIIDYYDYGTFISLGNSITGCMDAAACNYNANATCGDWYSCTYDCYGCTNAAAPNYNPDATVDDGSCCTSSWYTITMSGQAYWYATNDFGATSGGFFPEQSGFCMTNDCFSIVIYSFDSQPVEYIITNQLGEVIYSGVSNPTVYTSVSISTGNDVAGCMDSMACNYNPEATCPDGSCNYYCGGCTDSTAINFDPLALFDDGSCFYMMQPPVVGMMIVEDPENDQYWVMSNVMEVGNGAPYVMTNSYNNSIQMMNESGQYMSGPYPCNQEVSFQMNSMQAGLMTYMEANVAGSCAIANNVQEVQVENKLLAYPNPTAGAFTLTGINAERATIQILDMSGRVVLDETKNISNGQVEMNLSNAQNGIYQLRVQTSDTVYTARISVKQ